jgi:hypothetical protein
MDSSKKRSSDLPDFFMKYDDPLLACEHLVKLDANCPNTVSHFCAVPLDMVAGYQNVPNSRDDFNIFWPLKGMTVDCLSKLLTQLGRSRSGMNKKQMIAMIESLDHESLNMDALLEKKTLKKMKDENSSNKAVMRFVIVMFSPVFQKKFEDINNAKTRADLELKTEKKLFAEMSEYINDDTCGYHDELLPCEDGNVAGNYNFYINTDRISEEMHPSGKLVKQVNGKVVAQMYSDLFRINRQINAFMTQSGSHDGATNPWSYVVNAIKKCKLNSYSPLAVYYFYMQCSFHKGIAEAHTHVLKDIVKNMNYDGNSSAKASGKKDPDNEFMKAFCEKVGNGMEHGSKMRMDELNERKLRRLSVERNELKKSIDSGNAKRIKLMKEYRKCNDDIIKEYAIKSMKELDANLKVDEQILEKLTKEYMDAKAALVPMSSVFVDPAVKVSAFPISEITVHNVTVGNTSSTSGSGKVNTSLNQAGEMNADDATVVVHDDSDEEESMI